MKVVLEGFRVYETRTERVFPTEGTTLFQGDSGRGKSTLFTAVAWALYGEEKDTYSWNAKKKMCSVQVHLDDGVIVHRQKNPERLEVVFPDGKTITSRDEAQLVITERYGSPMAWHASAYLKQDRRNTLMEGSGSHKVALLEALAFRNDLPSKYLEVATDMRRTALRALERAEAVLQHTPRPVPNAPLSTLTHPADHIHYNEAQLLTVTQTIQRLQVAQQSEMERTMLQDYLTEKRAELDSISLWSDTLYDKVQKLIPLTEEAQRITRALEALGDLPDGIDVERLGAYTTMLTTYEEHVASCALHGWVYDKDTLSSIAEELRGALDVWGDVEPWKKWKKTLPPKTPDNPTHPAYSEASIAAARRWADAGGTPEKLADAKITVEMSVYALRYTSMRNAATTYQNHLDVCPGRWTDDIESITDDVQKCITDTTKELERMLAGVDVHTCPGCKKSLRIVNGALTEASVCPSNPNDINALERDLAWLKQTAVYDQVYTIAEAQMDGCPYTESQLQTWTPDKAAKAKTLLALPGAPNPFVSPDAMVQHNAWIKYNEETLKWSSWHHEHAVAWYERASGNKAYVISRLVACERILSTWVDPPELLTRTLLKRIASIASYDEQLIRLKLSYMTLNPSPDDPHTPQELDAERQRRIRHATLTHECNVLQKKIEALPTHLVDGDITTLRAYASELAWMPRFIHDTQRYEEAYKTHTEAQKAYTVSATLVDRIKTIEHKVLTSYLDIFNATLESILADVFDDPIAVSLRLAEGDKPDIQWKMAYKGAQDKSLADLSGGEQDRVSLAVSLALASTSSFPALMLDECFGSLDTSSRSRCLNVIRRVLPHKPVYVIAHGETEGDYDTTMSL